MLISDYNKQINRWKRLIDSVDKTDFGLTFIDKIHLSIDGDIKTIDVKRLKALNFYNSLDDLEYIIDCAIQEQDNIDHINVKVDTEAVMGIAIPVVEDYLKSFDE